MLQCSNRVFILLNAGLASALQTVKKKGKRSAGDIKLCQRVDKMLYAASPVPPFIFSLILNGLVISPSPHPVWFPEKGGDKHLALDLHFPPT